MDERYESFDLVGSLTGVGLRGHAIVGAGTQLVAGRTDTGLTGTLGASRADNTWRSWLMLPTISNRGLYSFAVRYSSLPVATSDLFSVLDSTGTALLTFAVTSTGAIAVYRGTSGGTLLGTSAAGFVSTSAYRYLEFTWIIADASAGSFEMHSIPASGSSLSYALTAIDTKPAAISTWAYTETYLLDGLPTIDDCCWNNGNGVLGGGFRGNLVVRSGLPVSDRIIDAIWVPSSGSNAAAMLDDRPANLDTDYVQARYLGSMDCSMDTIAGTGATIGVQVSVVARSVSSSELNTLRLGIRTTGSLSGGTTQTTTTAYASYLQLVTGLAGFTVEEINAGSAGVSRTSV